MTSLIQQKNDIYISFADAVYKRFRELKFGIHCGLNKHLQYDIDLKEIVDWQESSPLFIDPNDPANTVCIPCGQTTQTVTVPDTTPVVTTSTQIAMLQFKVGEDPMLALYLKNGDSVSLNGVVTIPVDGQFACIIKDPKVKKGSVRVELDGFTLPYARNDVESYTVTYAANQITITKTSNYPYSVDQLYIITYEYEV